jgi:alpha-tubulin suppressor-like RCC1 family protein
VTTAVAVSVSGHACAVLKDGGVVCWGANTKGQLGNGEVSEFSNAPVVVKGLTKAVAVTTGSQLSCALRLDRTVWCWGRDSFGALGTGGPPLGKSVTPLRVKDITSAVKISSLGLSTCALLANGNVKCWGANLSGQLGNGSTNYGRLPAPVKVTKVAHAVDISMGGSVGCAALTGGTVKCWGMNLYGMQGTGIPPDGVRHAETVVGVTDAIRVSAGYESACALLADGTARCWGLNAHGELGTGGINTKPRTAVAVKGLSLGTSN